jgi:predicted nicotinamide N-methyase
VCLELGAGTGLVGIAVAVVFPELSVLSTDLDEAIALMQENVDANHQLLPNNNMKVGVLDWAETDRKVDPVEILLLADVVYNDLSHEILLQTILDYSDEKTKILLGYKFRHEAEQKFFDRASKYFAMEVVHQQDTMQLFVMTRKPS